MHRRLAVVLTLCATACTFRDGPVDYYRIDGGRTEAGTIDASYARDVPPDHDPFCHWDCFGSHYCRDGLVHTIAHAPVPCYRWTGSCPESVSYTCERGCRTDGVSTESHREDPVIMCEEGRPKIAGDPCADDADCQPPSADGSFERIDRHHLACDLAAGTCIPIPDPTPADWLAACGGDLSRFANGEGYAYGVVRDDACSGALCAFSGGGCAPRGCTMPCEHAWQCPDGAFCREQADWTDVPYPGMSPEIHHRVCMPHRTLPCP